MSLEKVFASCSFAPATKDKDGKSTNINPSPIGTWKTTSYFIDSSGRSNFVLPLELNFASKEDLDVFLAAKCLNPAPKNVPETKPARKSFRPPASFQAQSTSFFLDPVAKESADASKEEKVEEDEGKKEESTSQQSESVVGFEIKSYSVDDTKDVLVEAVKILSCSVEELTVCFQTEVTIRASNHQYDDSSESGQVDPQRLNVLTNLEITPILTTKKIEQKRDSLDIPNLMALELGAIPDHMQKESSARVHETKLDSMALNVTLTHAFIIRVKSIQGPSLGNTLISLTIRHSNSHPEPVTISNIAFHPGHSQYETTSRMSQNTPGAQYVVSKYRWFVVKMFLSTHNYFDFTNNVIFFTHSEHDKVSAMGLCTKDRIITSAEAQSKRCIFNSSHGECWRRNA